MIRNVIFDMGGVLVQFDGKLFSSWYTDSEEDAQALDAALYANPSWALLDSGTIDEDTMERIAQARLPQRLWPNLHEALHDWYRHQPLKPETSELVRRLHEAGYGCYLLSNAGTAFLVQKDRIPGFRYMDGWVVSCFVRMMKPDPRIYQLLAQEYGLDPAECLFVDDNADNIRGAEVAGMQGHLFTTAEALEADLRERGVEF